MAQQTELDVNTKPDNNREKSIIGQRDWSVIARHLEQHGYAVLNSFLSKKKCEEVSGWYDQPERFRRVVNMSRYRFGQGNYAYFCRPLPALISHIQSELYDWLRPVAQRWYDICKIPFAFPVEYRQFQQICNKHGQIEPAALMLDYIAGDFNFLHQDLYGECVFPIQLNVQLNKPGSDFTGGEFVVVDQHPRRQSQVQVISLQQGDAAIFATSIRPVKSNSGHYRATLRHGVSKLLTGQRRALGIILHNAPN